jgi:hypothetical protein
MVKIQRIERKTDISTKSKKERRVNRSTVQSEIIPCNLVISKNNSFLHEKIII